MSTPKKRPYNSDSRQQQSAQTRKAILKAAKKLFQSGGFDKVKIEEIAAEASVSAPTIYAIFQSKKGILAALIDEALDMKRFEELVNQSHGEKSAKKKLAIAAKIAREIYDAERNEMGLLRGAAILDPELKALEQEREGRRYERQKQTIDDLYSEGAFKSHVSLKEARDILWAMTGRDLYRLFVVEKGWSSDEYERWIANALITNLLKNV